MNLSQKIKGKVECNAKVKKLKEFLLLFLTAGKTLLDP